MSALIAWHDQNIDSFKIRALQQMQKRRARPERLREPIDREELERRMAQIRAAWTPDQKAFSEEQKVLLLSLSHRQLFDFYRCTRQLLDAYGWACQLPGEMVLVVDNSIIQDFKHQSAPKQEVRRARAMAFVAFCRFVDCWSTRASCLAITPVAVYEHCGRRVPESIGAVEAALCEIAGLLASTSLPVQTFRYGSPAQLFRALQCIHHDAGILRDFAQRLHTQSWCRNLKMPLGGVRIPLSIAYEALAAEDISLKYFSRQCVNQVFSARIEELIAKQSANDPDARPVLSGPLSERLARLNGIEKDIFKGKISGLGDLELFEWCRIGSQFHRSSDSVFLAQTFDEDLHNILSELSGLVLSRSMQGGSGSEEIRAMAEFIVTGLHGDPFPEQTKRHRAIQPLLESFHCALADACVEAESRLLREGATQSSKSTRAGVKQGQEI
jgi:hypothetical protein